MEDLSWIPSSFVKIKRSNGYISGIVKSEEELVTLLENHSRATLTSFNAWSEHLKDSSKRRLLWQVEDFSDDVPLCVVKRVILACRHGKPTSRRPATVKEHSSEQVMTKKRIRVNKVKKLGCPAKLFIRHVIRYDTFSVKGEASRAKREDTMTRLKYEVAHANPPSSTFIHVRIPLVEAHQNHTIDSTCCYSRRIHPKVRDKIQELVGMGKTSVSFVKGALEEYVLTDLCAKDLCKPHIEDQAYFPSKTTIQNHIRLALAAGRYSAPDQENMERRVSEWEEEYYWDSLPLVGDEGEESVEGGWRGEASVEDGLKEGAEENIAGEGHRSDRHGNMPQRCIKSAKLAFRKELKKLIDDSYLCEDLETFRRSTEVLINLRKSFLTQCRKEDVQLLNKRAVMLGKDNEVPQAEAQISGDGQSKQKNGDGTRGMTPKLSFPKCAQT